MEYSLMFAVVILGLEIAGAVACGFYILEKFNVRFIKWDIRRSIKHEVEG